MCSPESDAALRLNMLVAKDCYTSRDDVFIHSGYPVEPRNTSPSNPTCLIVLCETTPCLLGENNWPGGPLREETLIHCEFADASNYLMEQGSHFELIIRTNWVQVREKSLLICKFALWSASGGPDIHILPSETGRFGPISCKKSQDRLCLVT